MKRRPAASFKAGRPKGHLHEEKLIAVLQWMEAHVNRKPNKRRSAGKDEQAQACFLERALRKEREHPELLSGRSKELLAQIKEPAESDARRVPLPCPEPNSSSRATTLITDDGTPPRKRSRVTHEGMEALDNPITPAAADTPAGSEDANEIIGPILYLVFSS